MILKIIVFSIVLLLIQSTGLFGQYIVKGKVTDRSGEDLPGVNVIEKGTTNGVSCGIDGNFELQVSSKTVVLEISYVGYRTKEITAKGDEYLLVELKEECHIDFFDQQQIELSLASGLINSPVGGGVKMSKYLMRQAALSGGILYETNFKENSFISADIGIKHVIVDCDINADVNFNLRRISIDNNKSIEGYLFSGTANLSRPTLFPHYTILIIGYGKSDFTFSENRKYLDKQGYSLGLGTYIGKPIHMYVLFKTVIWENLWEYQWELKKRFKQMNLILNFTNIKTYNEINIGVGYRFNHK